MYSFIESEVNIVHTFIKNIGQFKIYYWSLGNVFYITDIGTVWLFESNDIQQIENYAKQSK